MGYVNISIIISYVLISHVTANIIGIDTSFCCTSVVAAAADAAEWWISLLMVSSKYERTEN